MASVLTESTDALRGNGLFCNRGGGIDNEMIFVFAPDNLWACISRAELCLLESGYGHHGCGNPLAPFSLHSLAKESRRPRSAQNCSSAEYESQRGWNLILVSKRACSGPNYVRLM